MCIAKSRFVWWCSCHYWPGQCSTWCGSDALDTSRDFKGNLRGISALIVTCGLVWFCLYNSRTGVFLTTPFLSSQKTDICEHALETLRRSNIKRVEIVGRNGPLSVAFTVKELREMMKLPGCTPVLDPKDFYFLKHQLNGELITTESVYVKVYHTCYAHLLIILGLKVQTTTCLTFLFPWIFSCIKIMSFLS